MNWTTIGLSLGWIFLAADLVRAHVAKRRPSAATPPSASPKPEWQKYGHNIYPLVEIEAGIHKPPLGHFWELGRVIDEAGESWATIRLVRYDNSETVEEKSVSLDNFEPGTSWAARYIPKTEVWALSLMDDYGKSKEELARRYLVTPLVEWSRIAYTKHTSEAGAMVDTTVIA